VDVRGWREAHGLDGDTGQRADLAREPRTIDVGCADDLEGRRRAAAHRHRALEEPEPRVERRRLQRADVG
jgi:hypothetical protein